MKQQFKCLRDVDIKYRLTDWAHLLCPPACAPQVETICGSLFCSYDTEESKQTAGTYVDHGRTLQELLLLCKGSVRNNTCRNVLPLTACVAPLKAHSLTVHLDIVMFRTLLT